MFDEQWYNSQTNGLHVKIKASTALALNSIVDVDVPHRLHYYMCTMDNFNFNIMIVPTVLEQTNLQSQNI